MSDVTALILAWALGLGLGTMFFGGLWWTVGKAVASPKPAVWLAGSLLIRMGLALSGFYLVSVGHWQQLLVCLLGFVMSRAGVVRLTRPAQEANHAS